MKKITCVLWLCCLSATLLAQSPDLMTVKIEGSGFVKRSFEAGELLFSNKKYKILAIPDAFRNFEFLAGGGNTAEEGFFFPEKDGRIYVIAPSGSKINGWLPVANSEFSYDDAKNSKLTIYQKQVKAGQKIAIPVVNRFAGVSPIAGSIDFEHSSTVEVEGKLIDIWTAKDGVPVFSQNNTFKFKNLPESLKNKQYAVSLIDYPGPVRVKTTSADNIVIALHYNTLSDDNWENTGESFAISSARNYYIYKYKKPKSGIWIDIPASLNSDLHAPSLVFADHIIWSNPMRVPGTIIARTQDIKNIHIVNPAIVILPDGRYLASCAGAFRSVGQKGGASFFISSDKGKTWQVQSKNSVEMTFCNLFVHNGILYLMGTNRGYKDAVIAKSTDWGKTWTSPDNPSNGLLLKGKFYHSAPVPVVVRNGRIWRAMEDAQTSKGANKHALVMSAPVDADLLNADSWTTTNEVAFTVPDKLKVGHEFRQWLEGNVVVDKNGNVVNLLRVDELKEGGYAAIAHVSGSDKLTFDPEKDIIRFPGGGTKFTVRFDSLSNKYWAISNAVFDEDRTKKHNGKYPDGVHASLLRNRMVLMYSDDLRNWNVKDTLVSADNPFFYGFQYPDWQFDGNDIIAVTRTAFEEERGLPLRQHDANFLTFYRFSNFRTSKIKTLTPWTIKKEKQ
jgi:hypothetical protein